MGMCVHSVPQAQALLCPEPEHALSACVCLFAGCCRCVLSDSGQAVALTRDHKAKDPQEAMRVEKVGNTGCAGCLLYG